MMYTTVFLWLYKVIHLFIYFENAVRTGEKVMADLPLHKHLDVSLKCNLGQHRDLLCISQINTPIKHDSSKSFINKANPNNKLHIHLEDPLSWNSVYLKILYKNTKCLWENKGKKKKALFKSQCNTAKFPVVDHKSGQAIRGLGGESVSRALWEIFRSASLKQDFLCYKI